MVMKLAKEGHSAGKIGTILRDQHGIPLTKPITGKTITAILKETGLAPALPEDFENLMRKATRLRVHLEKNKEDLHNKRALQIVEAKIHKLSRYYKRKGMLPPNWKYEPKAASLI